MAESRPPAALHGRRIADGEFFDHSEPEPGDYGRMNVTGQGWRWFVCLPNGVHGVLDPMHVVTENEDGTITVAASIENPQREGQIIVGDPLSSGPPMHSPYWHGYLVDGLWKSAS